MNEEIVKKLDILIKLTAASLLKEDKNQTASIIKLKSFGISNKDIAQIINNSENYVSMVLSRSKKQRKKNDG